MSDVDGALESQTPKNDAVENVVERYRATISDLSRPIPRLSALLAVLLQAAVITLLIVSNFVTIWIRKPNLANGTGLSDSDRLLYLTGTTILATIISSFTVGQIRSLWFSLALSEVERGMSDKVLGKMRSVIGLALAHEKAKNFPITASYWVVGLITTAIVAGISPTNFPCKHKATCDSTTPQTDVQYSDIARYYICSPRPHWSAHTRWWPSLFQCSQHQLVSQ